MGILKLYDTEQLVYVKNKFTGRSEYWVIRDGGISPLYTRHKVRRRHIAQAVALFKDHPQGIIHVQNKELRFLEGEKWSPEEALQDKADSTNSTVDNSIA